MGRAYSPFGVIECGYLGRWPRLVWIRAVGPRGMGAFSCPGWCGIGPVGRLGDKGLERCEVPNRVPTGFIAAAILIRDNSCHSWFHLLSTVHLTALVRK